MIEDLRVVLEADSRIAYALLFGSSVKGTTHFGSDVDVAIGVVHRRRLDLMEIGDLRSRLEAAVGRSVDLVILDEAPPGLAYRVFRDGRLIFARESTRTPLIWLAPGVTKPGTTSNRPVELMSIYPTLADLTGLPLPAHVEEGSIRKLLANPSAAWDRSALTTHGFGNHAVRTEQWR